MIKVNYNGSVIELDDVLEKGKKELDLLNLDVYDIDGNKIGRVSDLGENRANDLLEIEKINGLRFVVPFVKEWVPVVDISNRRVVIKNSDGIDTTLNQENSNEI